MSLRHPPSLARSTSVVRVRFESVQGSAAPNAAHAPAASVSLTPRSTALVARTHDTAREAPSQAVPQYNRVVVLTYAKPLFMCGGVEVSRHNCEPSHLKSIAPLLL